MTPYVTSMEYHSSSVLAMDSESFADATEFTALLEYSFRDNATFNLAEMRKKAGQPERLAVDYIAEVRFTKDQSSGSWKISSNKYIEEKYLEADEI